ncbi:MAG: hypothetical protein JST86_11650 [Bacteroidetes bacterium]|nr:hypothetical protein [Bacteroidota bacterium]
MRGYLRLTSAGGFPVFLFKKAITDNNSDTLNTANSKRIFTGGETYACWNGTIRMTYIDKIDMDIKNAGKFTTGTFPLQLIFEGNQLSLYKYYDLFDHFFIQAGDSITELYSTYRYTTEWEKSTYISNPPTYAINPVYRDQILAIVGYQLTKKQFILIESLEYDKRSLVKLLKAFEK